MCIDMNNTILPTKHDIELALVEEKFKKTFDWQRQELKYQFVDLFFKSFAAILPFSFFQDAAKEHSPEWRRQRSDIKAYLIESVGLPRIFVENIGK